MKLVLEQWPAFMAGRENELDWAAGWEGEDSFIVSPSRNYAVGERVMRAILYSNRLGSVGEQLREQFIRRRYHTPNTYTEGADEAALGAYCLENAEALGLLIEDRGFRNPYARAPKDYLVWW